MKKKSKWQLKREKQASENSQFNPAIHELGREGLGFGMKKDVKTDPEELSGRNLPFSKDNDNR
jgi:hypothetical protein|tara:strand:- start:270 stop:458 length:189 start_codon:yes stop_codon:yes gene_type:complete